MSSGLTRAMKRENFRILRYPGGKQRMLAHIVQHLPPPKTIRARFVEPFLGGGAVFFALNPSRALLADLNPELIDLYRGLRRYPEEVWRVFRKLPTTKRGYYQVRDMDVSQLNLPGRAARTLYLNRTCFKGMWRHNAAGKFNVGYGGQDRRWVVSRSNILSVSKRLRNVSLKASDFEEVIEECSSQDFLFLDPPYRPGGREMTHEHYTYLQFTYADHKRLAVALRGASRKGVRWAMTTSSHPDILKLFPSRWVVSLQRGTGRQPGISSKRSGEVIICNYDEAKQ